MLLHRQGTAFSRAARTPKICHSERIVLRSRGTCCLPTKSRFLMAEAIRNDSLEYVDSEKWRVVSGHDFSRADQNRTQSRARRKEQPWRRRAEACFPQGANSSRHGWKPCPSPCFRRQDRGDFQSPLLHERKLNIVRHLLVRRRRCMLRRLLAVALSRRNRRLPRPCQCRPLNVVERHRRRESWQVVCAHLCCCLES